MHGPPSKMFRIFLTGPDCPIYKIFTLRKYTSHFVANTAIVEQITKPDPPFKTTSFEVTTV